MEDLKFGSAIRVARQKRRWRQSDLAMKAGVSRATVWRAERGRVAEMTVHTIRQICEPLEIRVELLPRGRGADLDRMLSARHSALHESVVRSLARDFPDWVIVPEVSFSIWGERGVIDLLLWHPGRRALLIIELKTELVDVGELLGTMDRRRRLAISIAKERGWHPTSVSSWVILADSRTNSAESPRTKPHSATRSLQTGAGCEGGWRIRPATSQRYRYGPNKLVERRDRSNESGGRPAQRSDLPGRVLSGRVVAYQLAATPPTRSAARRSCSPLSR